MPKHFYHSFLLYVFFQFIAYFVYGIQADIPETFLIHTDKPYYLTGETIWYKVYNTNYASLSEHSKVAYLNLHDKSGELLLQQKLRLNEGKGYGSIEIPISWKESYYYLTCFSKWNLRFESKGLAIQRIAIYNSFDISGSSTDVSYADPIIDRDSSTKSVNTDQVLFELNKNGCARREKIRLKISFREKLEGNISISVHSLGGIDEYEHHKWLSSEGWSPKSSPHYALELQDSKEQYLFIEGQASDPNSGTLVTSDVLSIYQVGGNKFYRVKSNEGSLRVKVNDYTDNAIFQLFNMNPYQSSTPIFEAKHPGKTLLGLEKEPMGPPRNDRINKYIRDAQLISKIHEIFQDGTLDSLKSQAFSPIPFEADKVYKMEKYQSMRTLKEFLKEIVYLCELKVVDEKTTVRLKNTETHRFFMEKPWYLVDGYLTRDEDKVLDIPFRNLTRVEIYNTNTSILDQMEVVMIRSGLIAVYTDNYHLRNHIEEKKNIFTFQGYSSPKEFTGVQELSLSDAREYPNFASLLYWNPDVNVNESREIEFITSDLIGDFVISVKGISEDGLILTGSKTFSVHHEQF